jgi:peptidoglycan/LPS O-acetylase OafA/YrhL
VKWKEIQGMSQQVIAVLPRSLMENEQLRRRQVAAFAVLFLATIGILFWIGHLANRPNTDARVMVLWSVIGVLVSICYGVMALAIYINRMNARLLRTLKSVSEQL